jgi:peptidoglycan DL-endopeptidase LytF
MTRRDTIILAVLINAGLLILLFITADTEQVNSISGSTVIAKQENKALKSVEVKQAKEQSTAQLEDEVDLLLSQLSSQPTNFEEKKKSPIKQQVEVIASEPKISSEVKLEELQTKFVSVTVKRGDVLEKIARNNSVSVSEIMKANHLTDTLLQIGQVLQIPLDKQEIAEASLDDVERVDAAIKYYIVKKGDSAWVIALRHKISVEELLKINGLDDEKARRLKPGDRLRIR